MFGVAAARAADRDLNSGEHAMAISNATAQWNGGLKDGKGVMKPAHGPDVPFTLASRFEGAPASNPEELIGGALAGCFSMALTLALETAGLKPQGIKTSAAVHLNRDGAGFSITSIDLSTEASVPGIDAAKFQEIAEATKKGCPVSKALTGTTITLSAKLA
jgi:osmotically inducible protein OsmC